MPVDPWPPDDRHAAAIPSLSRLELRVVALARRRGERGIAMTGSRGNRCVARLLAILGWRVVRPLANARLEELRRLAVVLYRRADPGSAAIAEFLEAGLTTEDIGAVRAALAALSDAPGTVRSSGDGGVLPTVAPPTAGRGVRNGNPEERPTKAQPSGNTLLRNDVRGVIRSSAVGREYAGGRA